MNYYIIYIYIYIYIYYFLWFDWKDKTHSFLEFLYSKMIFSCDNVFQLLNFNDRQGSN